MSLEQALAANTAALQALTAALATSGNVLPLPAPSAQPAPTIQPAPPIALYTAAAAPVPTAPVESTDGAPAPTTAFAQPAATSLPSAAPAAPPTAPPAASGERDSKGMPWDGRIHASSKAVVADGSWRYKRGTGDTYINQIEAEIRAALGAPAVAVGGAAPAFGAHPFSEQPAPVVAPPAVQTVVAAVPPAPIPAVAAVPPAPVAPAAVVAPPPAASVAVPVAPVAPVAPAAVVPTANGQTASGITTYELLMAALPPKIVSGELTAAQMQEACEQYGVPSIAALGQRPDLVPFVVAALRL